MMKKPENVYERTFSKAFFLANLIEVINAMKDTKEL